MKKLVRAAAHVTGLITGYTVQLICFANAVTMLLWSVVVSGVLCWNLHRIILWYHSRFRPNAPIPPDDSTVKKKSSPSYYWLPVTSEESILSPSRRLRRSASLF